MNNSMKAVGFYQHLPITDPASFEDVTIPIPTPGAHDLLVQVQGVSVNPVDTGVRKGGRKNKLAHPKIIGWDSVGTVTAVGPEVTLFTPGDRVWYAGEFTKAGSDEEFQTVDERIVGHAPQNLTDQQAAAIPLVGLTAYEALFEKMHLDCTSHQGESILIINGSGGVGSMAVQLAKLAGLTVIATASKPASIDWVNQLGTDYVVDHHQNLVKQVRALGFKNVDYILNLNNLDAHWQEISELIRPDGMIAATTENHRLIDLQALTKKRATFAWEWMYSKSYYQTENMITQHDILDHIAQLYNDKALQPVDTVHYQPINAENMRKAHADVESGHMVGKLSLTAWS